jgi:hypothetical protein
VTVKTKFSIAPHEMSISILPQGAVGIWPRPLVGVLMQIAKSKDANAIRG